MDQDGFVFYCSANQTPLAEQVPAAYITFPRE